MCGLCNLVKNISPSGNYFADGVTYGTSWEGPVTYYFTSSSSDYSYKYEPAQNFEPVTAQQQTAALFALDQDAGTAANDGFSVEGFTNVDISAGQAASATIRFGQSDAPTTAYAYMPGNYNQAGDMWFGRNYDYTNAQPGNYAWHTVLHEIGHALGLKHGHEVQNGFAALPTERDGLEYSLMTYRSYIGDDVGPYTYAAWSAPQTYMMADIAALQRMYGADYTTNAGNTVYKWSPDSGDTLVNGAVGIDAGSAVIFATIWDGGGCDTYDLSDYATAVDIDLRPGEASRFADAQLANLGGGHVASGSIYNALLFDNDKRSMIEAAIGGSASDEIVGNRIGNTLSGRDGDDRLLGYGGQDRLRGGNGDDVLIGGSGRDTLAGRAGNDTMSGGPGSDQFLFGPGGGNDWVTDFTPGEDVIKIHGLGLGDFGQLISQACQSGDDVVISFQGTASLTLESVELGSLTQNDFQLAA